MRKKTLTANTTKVCVLFMAAFVLAGLFLPESVYAATGSSAGTQSITESFNKLEEIVTSIISGIGTIITLWGISEWGLSYQGSDGMSQAQGFKRIAGGLVMLLAPQILAMLT